MIVVADDVHLVRAAQSGDVDAFEDLVHRHRVAVYRVALRMLGNPSDAEDAAQEAFLQAWRGLEGFRGDSAFSTWLYRIVTNRCLAMLGRHPAPDELSELVPERRPGPAELAEARDCLASARAAILALPPEQRAPLVLREFEGLSYDEIAGVLDLTLAAVKGRIHRARVNLVEEIVQWS